MKYEFRGQSEYDKKWIYSNKLSQAGPYSMMVDGDAAVRWTPVITETVGRAYSLGPVAHGNTVYQGDIVRCTFPHHGELYSKVFVVEENEHYAYLSELYRDYDMDPDTFEVSRYKNVKHVNERIPMHETEFKAAHGTWTVIGNRWENPELL